ncbi:hypothetical protein [Edwardsiella ictaluri]|uniref:hypothetical protein n=1 Tax=Edwardsiella ictaluri TaxID=67780 RepID=UPI0039F6E877
MRKYTGLLTAIILAAFSRTVVASTDDDSSFIKDTGFCYMYATRLTQTADSGLQFRGVNLFSRFNGQTFKSILNKMDESYGSPWVNANFQKGNAEAMSLSSSDLIYNKKYFQSCEAFADHAEKKYRSQ